MRKKQEISLSIPQPCTQDWDKMTPAEQGRHCSSCNKTVIDFSLYSDKELLDFFLNPDNQSCGRFNDYQLNRTLSIPEQKRFSFLYKLFFGTALASWFGLLFSPEAKGSNPVQTEQQPGKVKKHPTPVDTMKQCIYGVILSSTDKSHIQYASIYVDEAPACSVSSDANGKYCIRVPDSLIGKKINIVATLSGYTTVEFAMIAKKVPVYKEIKLTISPYRDKLMGVPMRRPVDTLKNQ